MTLLPRTKDQLAKPPVPDMTNSLLSCCPGLPKKDSHNIKLTAASFGYHPEVESKSLLLEIACTPETGPRGP